MEKSKLDPLNCDLVPYYLENFGTHTSSTTIHIFNREDAQLVAREIFKSIIDLKQLKKGDILLDFLVINGNQFEPVIKELLVVRQYRVELYRSSKSTKLEENQWQLYAKASPGNLSEFEEILFSTEAAFEPINILALKLFSTPNSSRMLAAAFCDTTTQTFKVCEFSDTDSYIGLESLLVQANAKECILPAGDSAYAEIRKVLARWRIVTSEWKRATFNQSAEEYQADVDRLVKTTRKNSATVTAIKDLHHGMNCVAVLISFLKLNEDALSEGKYQLMDFSFTSFMRLNLATLKALSVVPNGDDAEVTLFSVLNKCRTPIGQRMLDQWIRQPLLDENIINERLDAVEALVNDNDVRSRLHAELLRRVPDVQAIVKKLLRQKGSLQDCYRLYQAAKLIPTMSDCLLQLDMHSNLINEKLVAPMQELEHDLSQYLKLIENTIDLDAAAHGEISIDAEFDGELTSLQCQVVAIEEKMKDQLSKVAAMLDLEADKTLKLEKTNHVGYHFRVTRKDEKALRIHSFVIILESHKGGVKFTTKTLRSLNDDYLLLKKDYDKAQEGIVSEIMTVVLTYADVMIRVSETLATLDVLVAFAVAAVSAPIPYVRPIIKPKGSGILLLHNSRHPCLECHDQTLVIPNSVHFRKGQKMFYFVTGPNMGGKSTYIRQVGVIVLLAQVGSFVPCETAEISVVDSIHTRVGASDSLVTGASTFMAEMLETSVILESATADSLVLIDELGRGTSTYDGFGLAYAIAKDIATRLGCFCLFATHFHEITELAEEVPTIGNLHVAAMVDGNNVTMLYRVSEGVCDKSFGLHLAQMLRFPQEVLEMTTEKLAVLEESRLDTEKENRGN